MIDRRIGKIKVRRGKEIERKPIIFEEGELIYSIDKQRLFIGDGVLPGGILVSNRNYVVVSLGSVTKVIPSTGMYGDIIHETTTNRTYIIGYELDNVTLKLILLADGNCCVNLQNEIDDLYSRLRPLTACLDQQPPTPPPPPPPPPPYSSSPSPQVRYHMANCRGGAVEILARRQVCKTNYFDPNFFVTLNQSNLNHSTTLNCTSHTMP